MGEKGNEMKSELDEKIYLHNIGCRNIFNTFISIQISIRTENTFMKIDGIG